jgi:hypothetical protein
MSLISSRDKAGLLSGFKPIVASFALRRSHISALSEMDILFRMLAITALLRCDLEVLPVFEPVCYQALNDASDKAMFYRYAIA